MTTVFDNVTTGRPCLVGPQAGLEQLNDTFGRLSAVTFAHDTQLDGMVAHLRADQGHAIVALRGAQVLQWHPTPTSQDVLWLSPTAKLSQEKPLRGGSPICWPWFGAHPNDPAAPSHGFARMAEWCVAATTVSDDATSLNLQLSKANAQTPYWHDDIHVSYEIRLGQTLQMTLTVVNTGNQALEFSEALHTYLHVGDIADVRICGLENKSYYDQVLKSRFKATSSPLKIEEEADRIYHGTHNAVRIEDDNLKRKITLQKEGSASTVVWNPWIDKAERLGDLGPDGYRKMLCVETANIGEDATLLKPGGVHRISTTLAVEPTKRSR